MKILVRPMTPKDRQCFADLTALRPGYDRRRAEERTDVIWHIAFDNPVSDGKPTYFVAARGEQVVCHMGRMPTTFWVKGKQHSASFAHDLFSHPDLQVGGRGFFVTMKLYKQVEDTCDSFCGLCWTNDLNVKLQQSRKYDQLWVKPWVRLIGLERLLQRFELPWPLAHLAHRLGDAGLAVFDRASRHVVRQECELAVRFDGRFDRLAHRIGPRLGIAPLKDAAYLRWRYLDWPHLRTSTYVLPRRGGDIGGFVVLREPQPGEDSGRVLDLVCDPDDADGARALALAAIRHYRHLGMRRLEVLATRPALQQALRPMLFVPRGDPLPLFYLSGDKFEDPAHLADVTRWHHAFGDSEGGEVP